MNQHDGERQFENARKIDAAVKAAYGELPDFPIDPDLLARIVDVPSDNVMEIGSAKPAFAAKWIFSPAATCGSIAASLVVGALLGYGLPHQADQALIATVNGQMVARGVLAEQLTSQISSEQSDGPVDIGLSFPSTGGFCRTFTSDGQFSGVGCREGKAWRIEMMVAQTGISGANEYRLASSDTPPAVLAFVDELIEGDVLDTAAEVKARGSGWIDD